MSKREIFFHEQLHIPRGLTSIIGGGGKTSLLLRLGKELQYNGRVILCAGAKMFPPRSVPFLSLSDPMEIEKQLRRSNMLCVGTPAGNGKITFDATSIEMLLTYADYVLCEADGSKGLPLKAHLPHEPVLFRETSLVVLVTGVDGVGRRIAEAAHRPECFAKLARKTVNDLVEPRDVSTVIEKEGYGDLVLINKVESEREVEISREIARSLTRPCVIASIREGFLCAL